jgi:hypothetical protein
MVESGKLKIFAQKRHFAHPDRPFVVNNILFIVLELGTGFCQTYKQFLAVRALFGIAMGGLYGNVASTALEDCPEEARGIISGMLQQGYAFGYLLATVFARALVDTTPHGWRPLFWFGACPPILFIAFRLCLPETQAYRERQAVREAGSPNIGSTFIAEGKVALKRHWMLLTYMVLLMAGFNFMSHGSQDLYPTMLKVRYKDHLYNDDQVLTHLEEPIQFRRKRSNHYPSCCKPWCNHRWNNHGLLLQHLRQKIHNHRGLRVWRCTFVPIHVHLFRSCHGCGFL